MKRRDKTLKKTSGIPKWMSTYADMVTLILVFFVLLFSMSQINMVKFDAVAESFRNRMIFDFYPSPLEEANPTEKASIEENGESSNEFEEPVEAHKLESENVVSQPDNLDEIIKEVERFLETNDLQDIISAERTDRGVVLVLQEQLLFKTGEADILKSGEPFLQKIGELLEQIPNYVKVEGHTDNRPISTYQYPSNWELSGARAGSVIRFVTSKNENINPARLSAVGYADTRPSAPNNSEENWEKNRRVEIIILSSDYTP
ncbi:flagellar motor protein MotS [Halobacillus massiliensis]|uniref:flagellar motor protein MotS n=1 Tax=Halobacillus massiliensis TaxID=1926286 RepID=UPI0009E1C10B|nr:flagellar motor protein MotS [Halobacillus massiliensis]